MISIVPLTEERLSKAIALVTEVFPPEYEFEPADEELAASLERERARAQSQKARAHDPSLHQAVVRAPNGQT